MSRVLVALLAVASTGCLPLADIRPDTVDPEATDLDAEARGRALLEAAADAHGGLAAWQQKQTTELIFRDEWRGLATLMAPWPSSDVRANIVQRTRTFDSVVTFQDGAPDGLVWGIEAWKPWVDDGSGRQNVEDSDIRFMLPTTQYFVEMPFRMLEAELVRDAGPVTVDGVTYDTVYATWGGWSANEDYDQYVIYLDPQTHRWAKVAYNRARDHAPGQRHRSLRSAQRGRGDLDSPPDADWRGRRSGRCVDARDDDRGDAVRCARPKQPHRARRGSSAAVRSSS